MKQYRFTIDYDGHFVFSWGYALYSAFLETLPADLAQQIHQDSFYNQHITHKEWVINGQQAYPFAQEYFLQKFNTTIKLKEKNTMLIEERVLADKFLVTQPYQRTVRINFQTPTTFKQAGEHVLFPTKDLIMQSLTNKWNAWADEFILEDITWDNCKISRYNLRSASYQLKGVYLQGFVGYVDLYFWGAESLIRLGNLVCNFANYSGIGVKSALGMGGVTVD